MSTLDFRITSARLGDDAFVVAVGGEVDLYTAPQLDEQLQSVVDAGARRVLVDLAGVHFIDSTILGVLNRSRDRLAARGGELVLVSDDRRILRLFEVTGLGRRFRIERTLTKAVEALVEARG